ncbi:unnamed protein product [Vitrella brassicaformis CCMP3155]|uniref:Uncharacterized protein n=1 Tax=Vitrella brassicaformis (strain CCMP3155) TaxID=1169540 RepID=A0A0G4EUL8_VITBC|nr:unnamed protein product [Vitrella brassicaformis CCMP3155]|mmetsp:Transcript_7485/g.21507  ORF Transcript_7485/g.21507 Transcript_7485/m.21507 type:complete len:132 (-) Transcript_7485:417-812(-)|eukprot:CEM02005.1 unnamed protein product [Vitrella brassicaformis CCMP3155]
MRISRLCRVSGQKLPFQLTKEAQPSAPQVQSPWWSLYITGQCPDYPPRRNAYRQLTENGVDVHRMEVHEIENFVKWIAMRQRYSPETKVFPHLPYDLTLEDKFAEMAAKYPLDEPTKTRRLEEMDTVDAAR